MLDITNYFASFGGRTDAEKKLGHESWSDRLDCWDILMAENRGSGFGNEAAKRKKEENNMSEARQLQIQVEGLANLKELLKDHEGKKTFLMFIGSMCEEGDHIGESWCPDCRDVEPVVEAALQQAATDMVFILVVVGDKPTWKDPNNEFRTSEFKLTEIPTIVEYGTDNRLGCEDCKVQDKVNGFFPK